jgi:hypothetical protein
MSIDVGQRIGERNTALSAPATSGIRLAISGPT